MYFMGVDIGSASSKCVIVEPGDDLQIAAHAIIPAGTGTSGPRRAVDTALEAAGLAMERISRVISTGYGRYTFDAADGSMSELSCHARGGAALLPGVRTIIDVGGQDAKAMSVSEDGILKDFVMNDKCAAGTGRFLDVMARVLELEISQLASVDEQADAVIQISSTCVVFAESEVISQLAKNTPVPNIVAGIHQSAAARAVSLIKRVGVVAPVLMTGGVANNAGVVRALERTLGIGVKTSPFSQAAGALGAALFALESGI